MLPPPAGDNEAVFYLNFFNPIIEASFLFRNRNVHCPPLAGAGCTIKGKDWKGVDQMPSKNKKVQECDARNDE